MQACMCPCMQGVCGMPFLPLHVHWQDWAQARNAIRECHGRTSAGWSRCPPRASVQRPAAQAHAWQTAHPATPQPSSASPHTTCQKRLHQFKTTDTRFTIPPESSDKVSALQRSLSGQTGLKTSYRRHSGMSAVACVGGSMACLCQLRHAVSLQHNVLISTACNASLLRAD